MQVMVLQSGTHNISKTLQESTQSRLNKTARKINEVYPGGNAIAIILNHFNNSLLTHWIVFVLYIPGRKSTYFQTTSNYSKMLKYEEFLCYIRNTTWGSYINRDSASHHQECRVLCIGQTWGPQVLCMCLRKQEGATEPI